MIDLRGSVAHRALCPNELGLGLSIGLGSARATGGSGSSPGERPSYNGGAALTGDLVDGATITIEYGDWTDADTLSITLKADDGTVGTPWALDYGDAAPTFAYVAATMDGVFLWAEIIATNAESGLTTTIMTPVRVAAPNNIFPSGFDGVADGTFLVDLDVSPHKYRYAQTADGATNTSGLWHSGTIRGGKLAADAWYGDQRIYLREFDGPISSIKFKLPLADRIARGIPAGQSAGGIQICWADASGSGASWTTSKITLHLAAKGAAAASGWKAKLEAEIDGVGVLGSSVEHDNLDFGQVWDDDTEFEIRAVVEGGQLYYDAYADGVRLIKNFSSNPMRRGPVTPTTEAKLYNNQDRFGIHYGWDDGDFSPPIPILNFLEVEVLPSEFVTVSVGSVIQSPADPAKQRITISGSYALADDLLEWALVDPDGAVAENWTDIASAAAGAFSDTVDIAYADGGNPVVYVRSKTSPAVIGSKTFASILLPTTGLARLGMNEGYVNGSSSADPFEDWGSRIEWRDTSFNYLTARGQYRGYSYQRASSADGSGSTVKMDPDGRIYKDNGLGLTTYRLIIPAWFREPGTYLLKLAPGLSITRATGSTTWSYSGDELSITTDANGHTDSAFDIALNGAFPAGGILPVGKKQGDSYPIRPKLPASVASSISAISRGVRVMTSAEINGAINTEAGRTDTALPVETPANACAAGPGIYRTGADYAAAYGVDTDAEFLWYPTRHIADTALLAADMGKIATLMTSTSRTALSIMSELGNELWNRGNTAFYVAFVDMYLDGLRLGFAPIGVTTPGAATPETIIDGTKHIGNDGVLLPTSRTFTAGEKVFVNWSAQGGFITITITAAITAGQSLSLGTNCTMLYDNTSSGRARMRAIAYRAKLKWAAEDAVLAAAGLPPTIHVFS